MPNAEPAMAIAGEPGTLTWACVSVHGAHVRRDNLPRLGAASRERWRLDLSGSRSAARALLKKPRDEYSRARDRSRPQVRVRNGAAEWPGETTSQPVGGEKPKHPVLRLVRCAGKARGIPAIAGVLLATAAAIMDEAGSSPLRVPNASPTRAPASPSVPGRRRLPCRQRDGRHHDPAVPPAAVRREGHLGRQDRVLLPT